MRMYADLPVWLLPVFITLILLFAAYLFVKAEGNKRWSVLIRTTIWLGLIMLVANPWLSWEEKIIRSPRVELWVDRSLSINQVELDTLAQVLSRVDSVDFILRDLNTGASLEMESLKPIWQYTDFSLLGKGQMQTDAQWLVSDGNANQGKKSIRINSHSPLNIIAVGDTSRVGDLSITDLLYTRKMYVNMVDTLKIFVASFGYELNKRATVRIKQKSRIVQQASVTVLPESETVVKLPVKFSSKGKKNIKVELVSSGEDSNTANNQVWAGINVESAQKNLLLLYGYPIPEIRYFRHMLSDRKDLIFSHSIERFTGLEASLPDAVICFAYPVKMLDDQAKNLWKRLKENNIPIFYFSHEGIRFEFLSSLDLPFQLNSAGGMELFPVKLEMDAEKNPLINPDFLERDRLDQFLSRRPAIVRDFRLQLAVDSRVLLNCIKDNGQSGFLEVTENSKRRLALLAGWNSYLLYASALQFEVYPYWQNVMNTIVDWLLAPPLEKGIYHNIPDTLLQNIGSNLIKLTVVDDFGSYVNDAGLTVSISSNDLISKRSAVPGGIGYELEIPYLPVGDYRFEVFARWGIGQEQKTEGRFHVANPGPEKYIRTRNKAFLKGLAGGSYIPIEELTENDFKNDQIEERYTAQMYLFPRSIVLYIILTLFLIDLYIRRRYNML